MGEPGNYRVIGGNWYFFFFLLFWIYETLRPLFTHKSSLICFHYIFGFWNNQKIYFCQNYVQFLFSNIGENKEEEFN